MRFQVIALLLWIAGSELVCAADAANTSAAASAEVEPLLAEMGAAANAHDVDRHVGFYAHDDSVVFIFERRTDYWVGGYTPEATGGLEQPVLQTLFTRCKGSRLFCARSRSGFDHHFLKITSHDAQRSDS